MPRRNLKPPSKSSRSLGISASEIARVAAAQTSAARRTEVATLARDLLITAVSARGQVPAGQEMRELVRVAREFYAELDQPTVRPKPKPKGNSVDEDEGAELIADDEL